MQGCISLMSTVRRHYASPLLIALAGVAFLVSQTAITRILHRGDAVLMLMTLQTTCDPTVFRAVMSSLSEAQLAALLGHFRFDFLHPLWYGSFALLLLAWLFERNQLARRFDSLLWGAPLMAALDVLENLVQLPLMRGSLAATRLPVAFAAVCATLKWCLAACLFVLSAALILRLITTGKKAGRTQ